LFIYAEAVLARPGEAERGREVMPRSRRRDRFSRLDADIARSMEDEVVMNSPSEYAKAKWSFEVPVKRAIGAIRSENSENNDRRKGVKESSINPLMTSALFLSRLAIQL
jgi:hypothetical protein